jgi:hypothetical protein
MKKLILTTAIAALTLGANAGDWGKAPVDKTPIEECVDLGGEISAGYMSDYIFYGVRFAGDSAWTDVNYTFDGLPLPITIGAWYLNGINEDAAGTGGYDELDLYVSAALGTFAGFDVSLGYTHYLFPEFRSNVSPTGGYGEIGLDIKRSLGFVDLSFESNYAMGGGGIAPSGWYHQLGLERTFSLTDSIGLVLGAGVGYTDGYFEVGGIVPNAFSPRGSGWNHYYLTASLPIELNCRTTLTPYIGYNGGPDTWIVDGIAGSNEFQSDILHGGVSLNVTF